MSSVLSRCLRRASLLALTAMLALSMLGLHLHHEHGSDVDVTHLHDHDSGHDHDHDDDGDPLPDAEREEGGDTILHAHALDPMIVSEPPRPGPGQIAAMVARWIPQVAPPDGPVVGIDPPPVRPAA